MSGMRIVAILILAGMTAFGGVKYGIWPASAAPVTLAQQSGQNAGQPFPPVNPAEEVQRAVLFEEDLADPRGKEIVGTVVWRTERVPATDGQQADVAVRADIEIPDRKLKVTLSFRRNTDASLPASHTLEMTFVSAADDPNGGVGNVPGILMKSNELARGVPLSGRTVKVIDGVFLAGLANGTGDRASNMRLLKERDWFDVPIVYRNRHRAILAIDKGASGERAFDDAFAAWGQ